MFLEIMWTSSMFLKIEPVLGLKFLVKWVGTTSVFLQNDYMV